MGIVFGQKYNRLEVKPCRLGPRIRNVEAEKTEIKIIHFVQLCLDCVWLYGLPWTYIFDI